MQPAEIPENEQYTIPEPTGIAFIIGFYFASRIIFVLASTTLLSTEARTGAEISLGINFFLFILICFHSLGNAHRTFRSMLLLPSVKWAVIFLVFSLCSLAWSISVSLSTSFVYWAGLAADAATVVVLFRSGSVTGVSTALMKGYVVGACCLALVAWIMPAQSDLRLGDEEFFNSNQIGNLCAFAIFFAQCLMRRKEGRWGLAILFLSVTLLRSLSKTTIAAFLLSEGYLLLRDRSMSRRTKKLLVLGCVLAVIIFWGLFQAYYDVYTRAGNQAETFTGRTAIWAYALNAFTEQPWIGHGFDSMWKIVPPFGPDKFEARHAENEVLQQLYTYGIAGIVLLVGLYGSVFRQIRRMPKVPERILFLSLLLFVVIRGLAEAEPFDLLFPLWSIVLFSFMMEQAMAHVEHQQAETPKEIQFRASSLSSLEGGAMLEPN